jgi:hypothetical protein
VDQLSLDVDIFGWVVVEMVGVFSSDLVGGIDQRAGRIWIAKLLTWAGFSVEGDSREDALLKLDQQVKAQLAGGEIAYLDLPLVQAKNPWLAFTKCL